MARANDALKSAGFTLRKGQWYSPANRKISKEKQLDKIAKEEGYGSWKEKGSLERSKTYKRFRDDFEEAEPKYKDRLKEFNKIFRKAKAAGFKRGKDLVELLRATTYNPKRKNYKKWLEAYL